MTDRTFSPWPNLGHFFWLALRRAEWVRAEPWYGNYTLQDLKRIEVRRFWFPFISVRTKWFHFYVGWKPINLADPKFYWRELADLTPGELAVQLSARWGTGDVD